MTTGFARFCKKLHGIARRYGAKFVYKSDCNTKNEEAGRYKRRFKTIVVNKEDDTTWFSSTYYMVRVFCHELAHHIQNTELLVVLLLENDL